MEEVWKCAVGGLSTSASSSQLSALFAALRTAPCDPLFVFSTTPLCPDSAPDSAPDGPAAACALTQPRAGKGQYFSSALGLEG